VGEHLVAGGLEHQRERRWGPQQPLDDVQGLDELRVRVPQPAGLLERAEHEGVGIGAGRVLARCGPLWGKLPR